MTVELRCAYGEEIANSDSSEPSIPDGVKMDGFSAAQEESLAASQEKFGFQAEVSRLMDILINSLCKSFNYIVVFYNNFTC